MPPPAHRRGRRAAVTCVSGSWCGVPTRPVRGKRAGLGLPRQLLPVADQGRCATTGDRAISVEVGEGSACGFELGLQSGYLGGLLRAGLFDDLVDRGREILVQLLR